MTLMNSMMRGMALYGTAKMSSTMGVGSEKMNDAIIDIARNR
ncbi:hypothetical protein [Bifidobacterium callimiconis]|uniref:Uncharacterized protein n=1 Tax=Bifidobacterium callimiconis TaxID=2306973 RepID=A0A430F9M2_9BIFI|nr:hypothetical protein [Bifidobacterium callimiconis]RSX49508.1 hypothetical protein D2E23_2010 [Bifidobacterium callimiconis]